ncbi:type IV pilin protein [Aphanothece sacrum]|uniref:Pili assembly chaperone n=1 Tax=Aphanothece sacrum FPU1 TaxID=1920663 RepID=A0A401IJD2_APHSA|nr:type IV pilin-like G/H family protein [Aphanothece sacrum]GBF81334.1 pili assembly chaperone [Aphanothece sacrum FPU1]GBF86143.1 pili assembly chaperone [Aphanothece sacrum FPU3]
MTNVIFKHLIPKKFDQGFTLIELLVVVIIIGILSAIVLPQTMNFIAKSREVEARSMMGALNRAQQGYFNEKGIFATSAQQLEVPPGNEKYYTFVVNQSNDETGGLQGAIGKDNKGYGTRDYAGAVGYNTVNRSFSTVICRSKDKANQYKITGLTSINTTTGTGTVAGATGGIKAQCDTTLTEVEEIN